MVDDKFTYRPRQNPHMNAGPIVCYGTYPLPLPMWQQINGGANVSARQSPPFPSGEGPAPAPANNAHEIERVKKLFAAPYPEDDVDDI